MMPAADRKRALELHREVLAAAAGPDAFHPELELLALLVDELIRRGRRMLPVYHAAIAAYQSGSATPEQMIALRDAAIAAARAEAADDDADRKEADRG